MMNFIRIYLFFQGLLCFISYSKHLSVIYNYKNYGSLPYNSFIVVQNSRITLDRSQCIAIWSKFKMASLLLKNSISTSIGSIFLSLETRPTNCYNLPNKINFLGGRITPQTPPSGVESNVNMNFDDV